MKKYIATSSTCGPCHALKKKLKELNIEVETKDYTNPDDIEWFRRHNIRSVPRLVIEDGDSVEIIQGIEDILTRCKG